MKRPLLIALLATIAMASSPLRAQNTSGQSAKPAPSPAKVEMKTLDKAIDAVSDFLKKPEGAVPMAQVAAAQKALLKSKDHAPRSTEQKPKEEQAGFVDAYKIEINKALRAVLNLEDAMLQKDWKAAEKIMGELKVIQKAGHRTFKPRRRRR